MYNFHSFATRMAHVAGSKTAFVFALLSIIIWLATGPATGWSDTWQLVINTATTIVTFLMVFLIQYTQNRDTAALHLKIDELIRSHKSANNELLCIESLSEAELLKIKETYENLKRNSATP